MGAVYFGSRAGMGFGRDLRSAIFNHVTGLSAQETARFGAPSLLTRTTNDVQQIQVLVLLTCTVLITAPIMCVAADSGDPELLERLVGIADRGCIMMNTLRSTLDVRVLIATAA